MKVKILNSFVTVDGLVYFGNQEIEIEDKLAKQYIEVQYAEEIIEATEAEEKQKRVTRKKNAKDDE